VVGNEPRLQGAVTTPCNGVGGLRLGAARPAPRTQRAGPYTPGVTDKAPSGRGGESEKGERSLGPAALHAPWRASYIESIDDESSGTGTGCFLSDYWNTPDADDDNLVVVRTGEGMILLNRYPYASGHLLVALGEGRPRLLDYDAAQRRTLWELVDRAVDLVERTLEPQGINVGLNQGRAAGAGIPSHLHVHVIPRWGGDVNFMATIGQVRIIPASLETMLARFRGALEQDRGA